MTELFTQEQIQEYMRGEVTNAGGAKKWLRKNKVMGMDHVLHMVENGSAATTPNGLHALKFRKVTRYEPF